MQRSRIIPTAVGLGIIAVMPLAATAWTRVSDSSDRVRLEHAHVGDRLLREIASLQAGDEVAPAWPTGYPFDSMFNREAPVPPQCYTRTEGFHNPCYVCHQVQVNGRENIQNDHELQQAYLFSDVGFTNHWANLFEDRTDRIASISDESILDWVRQDNYSELAPRLQDATFAGWIPDLADLHLGAEAFDDLGFARDGSDWVAFNYKPLPSTFWPTNGAADDVMIRLPEPFRQTGEGRPSRAAYLANLALAELAIKDVERMGCPPIDESVVGADLDGDGRHGVAEFVVRRETYVGGASAVPLYDTIYPQGTEFLHTVRYLDVTPDGDVVASRRIKEVRYMVRALEMRRTWAAYLYRDEMLDKEEGKLPRHMPLREQQALQSETGWRVSGFIEDAAGRLRSSTFEETMFCMGCHNSVGATIDKTFSFARKVDGARGWGYIDLRGMPDAANMGEQRGEILTYLDRVGGGSEFRNNDEMAERWFRPDGSVDEAKVAAAADVHELITPSPERALALNKAYRVIVADQDYALGRDAVLAPPANVHALIDPETAPTLPPDRRFPWDIRLDWTSAFASMDERDADRAEPEAPTTAGAADSSD